MWNSSIYWQLVRYGMAGQLPTIDCNPLCMKKCLILSALFLSLFTMTDAQTAGYWPLNANPGGTPGSYMTVSTGTLGSSIPANSFNANTEWYGEGGWTAGSTIDPNGYAQFTLNANAGYWLSLTKVTLVIRRSNTGTHQG